MKIRTEAVETEPALIERPDSQWPLSPGTLSYGEPDWRSLFERERARAEATEARCEELRWKEVDSRARAGRLKRQFDVCQKKLEAAAGEAKEARRAAKDALSLKAEVARLEKLLAEAGVEPRKRSPLMSLRMEVVRLRKELSGVPSPGEAGRVRKALEERKETIHALRKEVGQREKEVARLEDRLAREKQKSAVHKETIRSLDEEAIGLYRKLRRLRDQAEVVESLSAEVYRLKVSLGAADIATERLKARLLRAMEAARSRSPSRADEELRKALWRSRRQKTAIGFLSRENARLRKALRKSETRQARLEVDLGKLRATGAVLSRRLFGRTSSAPSSTRWSATRRPTSTSMSSWTMFPATKLG